MNPAAVEHRLDVPIPWKKIQQIAFETTGQRDNPNWQRMRSGKLTSSIFGKAISARYNPHQANIRRIRDSLYYPKDLSHIPAIRWGIEHEADGMFHYSQTKSKYIVKPTGLWLFSNGCMGASPDGLVFSHPRATEPCGIVEIKCPYSIRDMRMSSTYMWSVLPYLDEHGHLKRNADYYHQVQGAMYAVNVPWCDFCIWTPKNTLFIIRVEKDGWWGHQYLPQLEKFYLDHLIRDEDKPLDAPQEQGDAEDLSDGWSNGMPPVPARDLTTVLYPITEANKELRSIMIAAFELHLTRIIYSDLSASRQGMKWKDAVYHFWDTAVRHVCETCLRSVFRLMWKEKAQWTTKVEMEGIIAEIMNEDQCQWSSLLYDPEFVETIRNKVRTYQPTFNAYLPPCFCQYTPQPSAAIIARYVLYFYRWYPFRILSRERLSRDH